MNGLVTVLGWLLLALTFTGSYRLATYLAPDDTSQLYPGLTAAALTIAFTIIVDVVILLTGVAVLVLPVLYLTRDTTHSRVHITVGLRERLRHVQDRLPVSRLLRRWRRTDHPVDQPALGDDD